MKKLNVCALSIIAVASLAFGCTQVKAEIKSNDWVTTKMIQVLKDTEPVKAAVMGSGKSSVGAWSMSTRSNYYAIPIEVTTSGKLYITVKTKGISSGAVNCGLYEDAQLTKSIGYTPSMDDKQAEITAEYSVKEGVYYFAMEKQGGSKGANLEGTIGAALARVGNRTIKSSGKVCSYIEQTSDKLYYKVNIEEGGKLEVTCTKAMTITLCDSDKNAIAYSSGEEANKKVSFGLRKGTYYLRITDIKGLLKLETSFNKHSVLSTSGYKEISIGKEYNLIVPADGNNNKKYLIALDLKNDTKITLNTSLVNCSGKLNFKVVYAGDTKVYSNEYYINNSKTESTLKSAGDNVWRAGRYYISVSKENSLSSGIFKIAVEN